MKHIFLTLILVLFIQQPSTAQQISSKNARSLKVLLSKLDKGRKTLEKKYSKKFAELDKERVKELEDITKPIIEGLKTLQKRVATEDLDQAIKIRLLIAEISTGENTVVEAEMKKEQLPELKQAWTFSLYSHRSSYGTLMLFLPDGTFVGPKFSGKWQLTGDKFTASWDHKDRLIDTGTIDDEGFITGENQDGKKVNWYPRYGSLNSDARGQKKRSLLLRNPMNVLAYSFQMNDEDPELYVFLTNGEIVTRKQAGKWQRNGNSLRLAFGEKLDEVRDYEIREDGSFFRVNKHLKKFYTGTPRYGTPAVP